jgi:hypothetical protein
MAELINAKCPNCGAILEFPANLDRAICMHCGGKVIIAKDEIHIHGTDHLLNQKVEDIRKLKKLRKQKIAIRNSLMKIKNNELDPLEKIYKNEEKKAIRNITDIVYIAIFTTLTIFIAFIFFNPHSELIYIACIILFIMIVSFLLFMRYYTITHIKYRINIVDKERGTSKINHDKEKLSVEKRLEKLDSEIYYLNKKLGITGYDPDEEVDIEKFRLKI